MSVCTNVWAMCMANAHELLGCVHEYAWHDLHVRVCLSVCTRSCIIQMLCVPTSKFMYTCLYVPLYMYSELQALSTEMICVCHYQLWFLPSVCMYVFLYTYIRMHVIANSCVPASVYTVMWCHLGWHTLLLSVIKPTRHASVVDIKHT